MSLFALKKHSLFLSLSLSLLFKSSFFSSFFDIVCFGCRFVFFSLSFRALLFALGEITRWSSLSLFSLQGRGDRKPHHPFVSLSLSLSLTKSARVLENPISLSNTPQAHKKRGTIISEKEEISTPPPIQTRARKQEKKRMDCGTAAHKESRQRRKRICENKSVRCVLPSVRRPRGACLQNSFFLRCFNIYICVCIFYQISLTNAFVLSARCCVRTRAKTRGEKKRL